MNTNTLSRARVATFVAVLAGGLSWGVLAGAGPSGAVAYDPYTRVDCSQPKRSQFGLWMEAGRRAVSRAQAETAMKCYASAMRHAWEFVPAEHLAFEALADGLAEINLPSEAAFCYQQALEILKTMKECDTSAMSARIDRKLSALPAEARQSARPLVPPPESSEEILRKRAAVPLDGFLIAFYRDIAGAPPDRVRKVVQTVLPTQEDVEALFPNRSYEVWTLADKKNQALAATSADMAKEAKEAGPVLNVVVVQVAGEQKAGFEEVLALMSPDVLVCTATLRRGSGETALAAYIWINGRWVWIPDLAEIPGQLVKK